MHREQRQLCIDLGARYLEAFARSVRLADDIASRRLQDENAPLTLDLERALHDATPGVLVGEPDEQLIEHAERIVEAMEAAVGYGLPFVPEEKH